MPIKKWDQEGPFISVDPSDQHVEWALMHNFNAMADMTKLLCRYFGVDRPDLIERITGPWDALLNEAPK